MTNVNDVKKYWEENPLFSLEVENPGSAEFFDALDDIKRNDVERFAMKYWEFDNFKGKKVLDVGCGPGWITVNYALGGAEVYAIDLTEKAVDLTQKFLKHKNAQANVETGNAENLKFSDNTFDLVVSSGVLHHTPDFRTAIKECYRVLKHGGRAKPTFYYKGVLQNRFVFPFLKLIMRFFGVARPGAILAEAENPDDFIRQYDGANNPVGIGKTTKDWINELRNAGFFVNKYELHFFPKRFVAFSRFIPVFLHNFLDSYFGSMIYFDLSKK